MDYQTESWIALGWRPLNIPETCRLFPDLSYTALEQSAAAKNGGYCKFSCFACRDYCIYIYDTPKCPFSRERPQCTASSNGLHGHRNGLCGRWILPTYRRHVYPRSVDTAERLHCGWRAVAHLCVRPTAGRPHSRYVSPRHSRYALGTLYRP